MNLSKKLPINLKNKLPITYRIIKSGNLLIDDRVKAVFISGSRGLANSFRNDSDIDIGLILDKERVPYPEENGDELKSVIEYTLKNWNHEIELDTALIFDINNCDFKCLFNNDLDICKKRKIDCYRVFKIQKGFPGFVGKIGVDVKKIFPVFMIWRK